MSVLNSLPIIDALAPAENILIAGAGGGFDIFCGLPLYFALQGEGKQVHLANLSFSPLVASTGRRLTPALVEIRADTTVYSPYFPELYLARWLVQHGIDSPVYCFPQIGVKPLKHAYETLVEELQIDTIILVDRDAKGHPHEGICPMIETESHALLPKMLYSLNDFLDVHIFRIDDVRIDRRPQRRICPPHVQLVPATH
jgi:hypothetical protein